MWESLEEYELEQFGVIKVTGPPSLCLVSFDQIRKGQTRPLRWGQRCICIKTHRKLNSQLMKQIDFFILSELEWNEMASSGQESVPSFNTVLSEIINECLEHDLWKRNGLNPLTPWGPDPYLLHANKKLFYIRMNRSVGLKWPSKNKYLRICLLNSEIYSESNSSPH